MHHDKTHQRASETEERAGEDGPFAAHEMEAIENKTPITPPAVFEVIRRAGEMELRRPTSALLASALVAGLAMGFSVFTQATLRSHLPDADWRPLIASAGYSMGFLIVILGHMQLFTENTITVVCPALERPCPAVFLGVARLWSIVLGANLLGACAFGFALWLTRDYQPDKWDDILALSRKATGYPWWEAMWRGVGAGWLIAAMVWIMSTAERSHLFLILVVTYVIALADFTHVIAGATEAAVLVATGEYTLWDGAFGFVLPALLGNIIGGTVLFTLLTWAQIRAELVSRKGSHHGDRWRN